MLAAVKAVQEGKDPIIEVINATLSRMRRLNSEVMETARAAGVAAFKSEWAKPRRSSSQVSRAGSGLLAASAAAASRARELRPPVQRGREDSTQPEIEEEPANLSDYELRRLRNIAANTEAMNAFFAVLPLADS